MLNLIQIVHSQTSTHTSSAGGIDRYFKPFAKSTPGKFFLNLITRANRDTAQRLAYLYFVYQVTSKLAEDIDTNLVRYILENPDISH